MEGPYSFKNPYQPEHGYDPRNILHKGILQIDLIRLETKYDKSEVASRTVGVLLVNGIFYSDTIEDYDYGWDENTPIVTISDYKKKHPKRTCIPSGQYYVHLGATTKFGQEAIFVSKNLAPNADTIQGFKNIRIHAGKNSSFTEGCILVGANNNQLNNQFSDYNNLSFDSSKLGSSGNPKWTPTFLSTMIKEHGGWAYLIIKRSYPSQILCDKSDENKYRVQCLNRLKSYRNDTIRINELTHENIKMSPKPFKLFPSAKPGGKIR